MRYSESRNYCLLAQQYAATAPSNRRLQGEYGTSLPYVPSLLISCLFFLLHLHLFYFLLHLDILIIRFVIPVVFINYRVSIKSFPDYKHLLQENNCTWNTNIFFFTIT